MAVAKVQNLKQEIAKIDTQTLQYMAQLIAENSPGLQNVVNTVLSSRKLNQRQLKTSAVG